MCSMYNIDIGNICFYPLNKIINIIQFNVRAHKDFSIAT